MRIKKRSFWYKQHRHQYSSDFNESIKIVYNTLSDCFHTCLTLLAYGVLLAILTAVFQFFFSFLSK